MNLSKSLFLFLTLVSLNQLVFAEGEDQVLDQKTHQIIYGENLVNPYPVLWLREGPDIIRYLIPDDYRTSMVGVGWRFKGLGYHTPVSIGGQPGPILKLADLSFAYGFNGMTHSLAMGKQDYGGNVVRNLEPFINQNAFVELEIIEGLSFSIVESSFFDKNKTNDHSTWDFGLDYNNFQNPNLPSQGFSVGAAYSLFVDKTSINPQLGYGIGWFQELSQDNLVLYVKSYGQNVLGTPNPDFAIMNKGPKIFNNSPLFVEAAEGEQNLGDFGFRAVVGLRLLLGSVEGIFDWAKGIFAIEPNVQVEYRAYNHLFLEPELFLSRLYYQNSVLSTEYGLLLSVGMVSYQNKYSSKPLKVGIGFALSDQSDQAHLLLLLSL